MKEFPRKFLSLRDKSGSHRRSKSVPPGSHKSRPLSAEAFLSIFKPDTSKQSNKSEAEVQNDEEKIKAVQRLLDVLNITNVSGEHIRAIMATQFANGEPSKAAEFIDMEQKAASGTIAIYDPSVHMLGAENRGGTTCYLDALLFAMFSKLDAFECMLKTEFPLENPKAKLVLLLRMWVNMLRTGKLIRTDMTKLLQDALGDCGWSDARLLEQQDTSEAFAFLTETLQLPLLSLQVDLFHHGKKDDDDHKVVYERLLNLAVPPDPDGKGIKLEDCLEEYFNAQVDVLRDSEDGKRLTMDDGSGTPTLVHRDTVRLIRSEDGASSIMASPIEISSPKDLQFGNTQSSDAPQYGHNHETPSSNDQVASPSVERRPSTRERSTSVIQRVVIDDTGRPSGNPNESFARKSSRKGSVVVKAVTIPAWQFFRLIPWHAIQNEEPKSDVDVAINFDQRPVVGICLKRYAMTETGQPKRHNTYIDIPDSLRLPHFMFAGNTGVGENGSGLNTEYKLVLQSVICHRGDSLQSGHYIAFARVAPKLLTGNRRHDFDPPPDYEEAQWVKFDDLAEERVTYVDNIKTCLREEMPYLLFYQIVPMVDATCPSTGDTEAEPPSYNASKTSLDMSSTPSSYDPSSNGFTKRSDSMASLGQMADSALLRQSQPPSIRLSAELDRPSRKYLEGIESGSYTGSTPNGSRRQSVVYTDSAVATPAITPDTHSPVILPVDGDQSTASRLSRAASRFALGKQSRPASQSGEGRLSSTMTRLGLMKGGKESLPEPTNLNISTSNSTGPHSSGASNQGPDSPVESDKQLPQTPATPKAKQKNGKHKEKEKSGKNKSSTQPERECSVM